MENYVYCSCVSLSTLEDTNISLNTQFGLKDTKLAKMSIMELPNNYGLVNIPRFKNSNHYASRVS
jgi:hypothetical protein